jgi:WD40 repeat protein
VKPALFAPDGRTLVTDTYEAVSLWETTTGKRIATLGLTANERGWTNVLAATPDGRTLLSAGTGKVRVVKLWDVAARRERATLTGISAPVAAGAFTADSTLLATGHEDGTVNLWDAADGRWRRGVAGHGGSSVTCVAFAADGKVLAAGGWDKTVLLCDPATGAVLATLQGQSAVRALAFAPEGPLLAAAEESGAVRLWDRETYQERASLRRDLAGLTGYVYVMAFAPDGRTLATCQAGTLKLWDTATGLERLTLWEHTEDIKAVAFSADGTTLAAASDRTLRLWHAATEDEILARGK